MGVLQDILAWSENRAMWQRDALRRLVTQDVLSDNDLGTLTRLCLEEHEIVDEEHRAPEAEPLDQKHLPQTLATSERVQLQGIRDVKNVNTLAPDQKMGFELDGLTVIFGYNGSGKSGYARILRSVCHARHRGDWILPDAFAKDGATTPSATIDFRVGGANCKLEWQQGKARHSALQQVSLFDAQCAAIHVDEANELAFTPFGLDVMPKLVTVCQHVQGKIQKMIDEQAKEKPASLIAPQPAEGTGVRQAIDQINKDSDIEKFRQLAYLSDEEVARLKALQEMLTTDPVVREKELRNIAQRFGRLRARTKVVVDLLSDVAVGVVQQLYEDAKVKKKASQTAANDAFGDQPLAGVGEKVWHELWKAARTYSTELAYPNQSFPYSEGDARCVLCQQPLSDDAKARLSRFEVFIQATTKREADEAQEALDKALNELKKLSVGRLAIQEHLPDIPTDQVDFANKLRCFHGMTWKRRRKVSECCDADAWPDLRELPKAPFDELDGLIRQLEQRADEIKRAADKDEREKLRRELKELVARQWLAGVLKDVEMEISRKVELASLEAAQRSTTATGITRQSTALTKKYVNDVLFGTMKNEIRDLGAVHLRVELESRGGQKGSQRFQVVLDGAAGNIKTRDVLSEGEFRCIALAGFLAELSTEHSGSALVFDDPVSSLDHRWRRKVANRLVKEAKTRQVIVFTHEIAFLADLRELSDKQNVSTRYCCLTRGAKHVGECLDGVPWQAMTVKNRLGVLKDRFQAAETVKNKIGDEAYEPLARQLYGLLRETWERGVEELLLNGVIIRFERSIQTQRLRNITDINEEDLRIIDEGMSKCSRFLEGHDEAGAVMDPVPGPDELKADIDALEQWAKAMRKRRP